MKLSALACLSGLLSVALSGCLTSPIHKRDAFDDNVGLQTLSIDAKQRLIVVAKGPDNKHPHITCAEPSPDALSALSSSVGGSVTDPKVAANFAAAQVESAASIGLRTQSIQLLRDGMYRLCEQYAAGALKDDDWVREQRRYQNLMLSLLAIEQLTGAVTPRQVGLGDGTASGTVGDKADEAAGNLAKANSDVISAQSALKKAQDTQASDQKACAADKTSPSCGNSADDETAVKNAQAALDKANENQKTAQQAMQAARGAVTTSASGAKVNFSDANKTNQITDGSARYVAEATRAIVTTTLLASFAQEECTRVWNFLDKVPLDELKGFWAEAEAAPQRPSTVTGEDILTSGKVPHEAVPSLSAELVHLAKNCQTNEKTLLGQREIFAPQYASEPIANLQVLGGKNGLTLDPGKSVSFVIIGGIRPYIVSGITPDLKTEVTGEVPAPTNGVYQLEISRPADAKKTSGNVTISVADSANEHVDIVFSFAKPEVKSPEATPGVAKITKVTSIDGAISVTFTPPSGTVKSYTAKATNQAKGSTEVLQANGAVDAKEIDIPKCTGGASYAVSLEVNPTTGSASTVKWPKSVKCSGSASSSPPATAPAAPTNVVAKAETGGKIVVTFKAGTTDSGPAATGYTAVAFPVIKGGQPDKSKPSIHASTPDGKVAPITLSGCVPGTNYVASVVAAAGKVSSNPESSNVVTCTK